MNMTINPHYLECPLMNGGGYPCPELAPGEDDEQTPDVAPDYLAPLASL